MTSGTELCQETRMHQWEAFLWGDNCVYLIGLWGTAKTYKCLFVGAVSDYPFPDTTWLFNRKVTCNNSVVSDNVFPSETWSCQDMRWGWSRVRVELVADMANLSGGLIRRPQTLSRKPSDKANPKYKFTAGCTFPRCQLCRPRLRTVIDGGYAAE